jgi:hypothetical protein
MDELLAKVLIEGGSLAIFVVFVLYLTRGQAAERVAMLKMVADMTDKRDAAGKANMVAGLASLDKVNGSIRDLVNVNVELSKMMAVHDATASTSRDDIRDTLGVVLSKLDAIQLSIKEKG